MTSPIKLNPTHLDLSDCEGTIKYEDLSLFTQLRELSLATHGMKNLNFVTPLSMLEILNLSECDKLKDNNFIKLRSLKNLTSLDIKECAKLTYDVFDHLKKMTQLKKLIFSSINEDEEGENKNFQLITHLFNLSHLEMAKCDITDNDAFAFSQFNQLNYFYINECKELTDKFFYCISQLTNLTELKVERCIKITGSGLVFLNQLSNLKAIHLNECVINRHGLVNLGNLTQLHKLSLFASHLIQDDDLKNLLKLIGLNFLDLSYCKQITNMGVAILSPLPQLKELDLAYNENITMEGIRNFVQNAPNKEVRIKISQK